MPTRPALTGAQMTDGGVVVLSFDQDVEAPIAIDFPAFVARDGGGSAVVAVSLQDISANQVTLQLGGGDQAGIVPDNGEITAIDSTGVVGVDGGLPAFPFVARSLVPRIVSITYHVGSNTVTVQWSEEATHDVTGTLKVRTSTNVPRTVSAPSVGDGTVTWTCPTTAASNTVPVGAYIAQQGVAVGHLNGLSAASAGPMLED